MATKGALFVPKKMKFYRTVARLRAKGYDAPEIARRLKMPEGKVRQALDYIVTRYVSVVTRNGPLYILAEQAMAIEYAMAEYSAIAKNSPNPLVKINANKARDDLRRTWIELMAKSGAIQFNGRSFFDDALSGLNPEEKKRLVSIGQRRLKQALLLKGGSANEPQDGSRP